MNCRNGDNVNSKNSLRQHIHACCFGAKLRMCVLEKDAENLEWFLKCLGTHFLQTFKLFFCIYFSMNYDADFTAKFTNQPLSVTPNQSFRK